MRNRKVIPMLCLSALLAGGIFLGAAKPVQAADSDFSGAYDAMFKLSGDHIENVKNNGGKYGASELKYLIDGNTSTHWETGKPNSTTFKNEVVFTFDESVELGSIVYYPRKNGAANKGFPTEYSVYASDSGSGDDFELVTHGSAAVASGAATIEFEPTSFQRLKFVFDKANQNWAAGAEMMFYYPDLLPKEVAQIFSDGTMTALKPEYQNVEVLEEMLDRAKAHPDPDLEEKVQKALDIQRGEVDYVSEVFTVEQRGATREHSTKVLRTGGYSTDMLPTGYAALSGDQVKIYVDVEEGAPLPSVIFTQQVGKFSDWYRTKKLHQGENIFTVPKIFKDSWSYKAIPGGAIYILNPYTPEEQGAAPRIRIEGAEKYPLFREGDNEQAFLEFLQEYKQKLEAYPETTVDVVELCSDKILLNGNMKSAATFFKNGKTPQAVLDFHDLRQEQLLDFAGIDDREFIHSRYNSRANVRLMQPFAAGYAAGDHVGVQQGSINTFFRGELTGWLYSHELGHQLDTREGCIAEVTNNMWANRIAVDMQNESDRVKYGNIFKNQASDDYADLVSGNNELAMFWQLYLLNEDYWRNYQSAYRENLLKDAGLTKKERMAVVSCYAVGMDVIEHFERYKFVERNENIDQALASLNIPKASENIKPWYLWTKATKDRVSTFGQNYIPQITNITKNGSNFTVTLSIDESADQALLGYEVMEDGKVLGFTSGKSFTGTYTDDGQAHIYTVRAYDLRLNASEVSEAKEINFRRPSIQVTGSTMVPLRGVFQPMDLVRANSYDGTDITANITVAENNVDTSARGMYQVVYQVADEEGNTAQLAVDIEVVSGFTYLSDLQETSASVGYGSFMKDKSIKGGTITLLRNQVPVTFSKGLGTHASSSVIYDLQGKYTYFESYVGIDQAVKGAKAANAKFRVAADGVVVYESGVMKADTDAEYVKLDMRNVNTLELITDSNGANGSDHTVWGGARVATSNSVPVIHARNATFLNPESVDLGAVISQVTAEDVEDGDLTGAVSYDTNFQEGRTGSFDIIYSVTDSDGNTTSVARKIVVVNDFVYASDTDWKSAKVGWGKIQKDRSLNGKAITLAGDDGVRTYEKGLGVHAYSEVVYDLTDKDYYYFTSDAGVDNTAGNAVSSVTFEIYVDGVLAGETPVMRKGTPAVQFCVDVSNAKELKLVVTAAGNGNGNDHANWADAKFLTAVKEAEKDDLFQLISQAQELEQEKYTAESWEVFAGVLMQAQEVYERKNASQEETDLTVAALKEGIEQLKLLTDTSELEDIFAFAEKMTSLDYVDPALNHRETRLMNVKLAMEDKKFILESQATQEEIDQTIAVMRYHIEETGQVYEKGKEPVRFVESEDTVQLPDENMQEGDTDVYGGDGGVQEEENNSSQTQPEILPEAVEHPSEDMFDSGDLTQSEWELEGMFTDF
ncbi:MAG: NPCBM/NEW2 domain-containing protein [Eubacteriales bacterium]|nr:NPCBM/NEW2 domain-containing protein [Eubacteriales bacterium]